MKYTKADKEWATKIKTRDKWTCQRCGKSYPKKSRGLHAAHIISRRFKNTRHDLDNGVSLCFGCHRFLHSNPLYATDFFKYRLGEEKFEELRLKARKIKK